MVPDHKLHCPVSDEAVAEPAPPPSFCGMSEETEKKPSTVELKRAAFQQTTEFARPHAEAEKKARDEKTARLRALRLAGQNDH